MNEIIDPDRPEDVGNEWDLENAILLPAVKPSSVVVSVRLRRNDFDKIAARAESDGLPTSTFLRNAALEKVDGRPESKVVHVYWGGAASANFNTTAIFGHTTVKDDEAALLA